MNMDNGHWALTAAAGVAALAAAYFGYKYSQLTTALGVGNSAITGTLGKVTITAGVITIAS